MIRCGERRMMGERVKCLEREIQRDVTVERERQTERERALMC